MNEIVAGRKFMKSVTIYHLLTIVSMSLLYKTWSTHFHAPINLSLCFSTCMSSTGLDWPTSYAIRNLHCRFCRLFRGRIIIQMIWRLLILTSSRSPWPAIESWVNKICPHDYPPKRLEFCSAISLSSITLLTILLQVYLSSIPDFLSNLTAELVPSFWWKIFH